MWQDYIVQWSLCFQYFGTTFFTNYQVNRKNIFIKQSYVQHNLKISTYLFTEKVILSQKINKICTYKKQKFNGLWIVFLLKKQLICYFRKQIIMLQQNQKELQKKKERIYFFYLLQIQKCFFGCITYQNIALIPENT